MNPLDRIFKNKLSHHTAPVPNAMWEHILSRLPEEKRKRRAYWPYAAFFAIAISSLTTYMYFEQNTLEKISDNNILISDIEENLNVESTINETIHVAKADQSFDIHNKDVFSFTNTIENKIDFNLPDEIEQNNRFPERIHTQIPLLSKIFSTKLLLSNIHSKRSQKTVSEDKTNNGFFSVGNHITCPTSYPVRKNKNVELLFSHNYVDQNLLAKSEEYTAYANQRKGTEKTLYSFSTGIRLGYDINDSWGVQTGISYSAMRQRFQYIDPESNQTREITIKDYVYKDGKIIDSTINKQTVIIPGENKISKTNTITTWDIPVIGSYTIMDNKKWGLSATAGAYVNIQTSSEGKIFAADNTNFINLADDNEGTQTVYKTQMGISPSASLRLSYHITSRLDIIAEPNARFQLQSITKSDYPLHQRFNVYGLQTSVRYKF